jgi:DNA repair protein RadA/Sms
VLSRAGSVFECQSCGYASPKWLGRCPDCGSWNSFVEEKRLPEPKKGTPPPRSAAQPTRIEEISSRDAPRVPTGDSEFDRVLGGGIVPGSLVLLGGEPGVGKSTLLVEISRSLQAQGRRVLYVSGEESPQQIKLRADRLHEPAAAQGTDAARGELFLMSEANLERVVSAVEEVSASDLVIDSIQTTFSEELDSAPGSISQVRHVATRLLDLAKSRAIPVFLIGHITKDGSLAGPKALEHIVDAVLYFEGERHHNHRIVRAVKNRFGASNEIGVFEMTARGLVAARNPSDLFLREREVHSAGSAVICALHGTRPLLVEVQALVTSGQYGTARRMAAGIDYNRLTVLVAMLEKRLGCHLLGCDVYVNAAGGMEVDEPAADLGIVAAILSSFRNHPILGSTVLVGELGLGGEARPVVSAAVRVREAASLGFRRCILPAGNFPLLDSPAAIEVLPIRSVADLSDLVFG